MSFPHLRVHSDYTLGTGASKPADLIKQAASLDMPAMALTDHNALYGAMTYSNKSRAAGLQPIIGMEIDIALRQGDAATGSVIVLAASKEGYKNLCHLLRSAYALEERKGQESFPAHICATWDHLLEYCRDVIVLTGNGEKGILSAIAHRDGVPAAHESARALLKAYGSRMYVEICRNTMPGARTSDGRGSDGRTSDGRTSDDSATEPFLLDIASGGLGAVTCDDGMVRSQVPLVATTDVWYATPDRHTAFRLLESVRSGLTLSVSEGRIKGDDGVRYHLRSYDEMAEMFHDLRPALQNTFEIAMRTAFLVEGHAPILPPFKSESGLDEKDELVRCSREGLAARLERLSLTGEQRRVYEERLEYELGVIISMGFPGYFLIVSDFIRWAKARGIPVGPGRGSGAGSVVAWALLITNIDPIVYGLLFERFLNPDRVSMPDFDIDFCIERRHEVIEYVRKRYGDDRVSTIVTFGGIMARTAIRDTGRVLLHDEAGHFSFRDINDAARLLPTSPADAKKSLKECERDIDELRHHLQESPKSRTLFDYASSIEKLYRQSGTHAAGIIIGDRPLDELFPVVRDAETLMPTAAFSQTDVEAAGAVKFDFLGLRNLTIIRRAIDYIRTYEGVEVDIDDIPLDMPECYSAMAQGLTTGVFQLSSRMMRDMLVQVSPTCLDDIVAVNALGRPGPMKYIPNYAARKAGREKVVYPGPEHLTKPILEDTYGFMVYQEQVMRVAQVCAGYSLGGADLLRRAMGKKKAEEMARQKQIFIHGDDTTPGAVKLGMTEAAAAKLFTDIEAFAAYGFNKSHAVAYALIAYQTIWLKVNYPACFYAALMTYTDKPDVLDTIKHEMKHFGLTLLPPDISKSEIAFIPERISVGGEERLMVRFGLSAIKNISADRGAFIAERRRNGPFIDLADFQRRVRGLLNSTAVERLVDAGCFDRYARTRQAASRALKWLFHTKRKDEVAGQDSLFGAMEAPVVIPEKNEEGLPIADAEEWTDRMAREFAAVGFYFGQHPVSVYNPLYRKAGIKRRASYASFMRQSSTPQLENRKLCVLVNNVFHGVTQKGEGKPYLKVDVSEPDDRYTVLFFTPRSFGPQVDSLDFVARTLMTAMQNGEPVVIEGNITFDGSSGSGASVIGQFAERASVLLQNLHADRDIIIDNPGDVDDVRAKFAKVFAPCRTDNENASHLRFLGVDKTLLFELPGTYEISVSLMSSLNYSGNVVSVQYTDAVEETFAGDESDDDGQCPDDGLHDDAFDNDRNAA